MADETEHDFMQEETNPVGDFDKRRVQSGPRIGVKENYLDQVGLEEGDDSTVVCLKDAIIVIPDDMSLLGHVSDIESIKDLDGE